MKCKCPKGYPITSWEPFDYVLATTGAGPRRQRIDGLFRLHTGKCPLHDEFLRVRRQQR
jgi:hypothetical protein